MPSFVAQACNLSGYIQALEGSLICGKEKKNNLTGAT